MRLADLPQHQRDEFTALLVKAGLPADSINLPIEELAAWLDATDEDTNARLQRNLAEKARVEEIQALAEPVWRQHPNLELGHIPPLLPEPQRSRLLKLIGG